MWLAPHHPSETAEEARSSLPSQQSSSCPFCFRFPVALAFQSANRTVSAFLRMHSYFRGWSFECQRDSKLSNFLTCLQQPDRPPHLFLRTKVNAGLSCGSARFRSRDLRLRSLGETLGRNPSLHDRPPETYSSHFRKEACTVRLEAGASFGAGSACCMHACTLTASHRGPPYGGFYVDLLWLSVKRARLCRSRVYCKVRETIELFLNTSHRL